LKPFLRDDNLGNIVRAMPIFQQIFSQKSHLIVSRNEKPKGEEPMERGLPNFSEPQRRWLSVLGAFRFVLNLQPIFDTLSQKACK